MQKKLFALAMGTLLFGGSLAAVAANQTAPAAKQATCCDGNMSCCDGNSACCDKPCCDRCPSKGAN